MKRILTSLTALALAAFANVAGAQTLTQTNSAPYPGPNDVSLIFLANDGLNYYDNNATPPGQTFVTGNNGGGYTLTNMVIKTAGGGGGGETSAQTYTLRIYSVASGTATLITSYSAILTLVQNDWIQFSGLSVPLAANTQYAYTISDGTSAYEELAVQAGTPYPGGQICLIPTAGGAITYGHSGALSATFDAGLAPGSVAAGTVTLTQSATAPTPGANDARQLASTASTVPAQADGSLNYYDNNNNPPGQTFTTLTTSPVGYVLTNLWIETAGNGGAGETGTQTYTLRLYSMSGTTATLLTSFVATLALVQNDWLEWSGLYVPLKAGTQYAYTITDGTTAWEHLADYGGTPYTGGSICTIPYTGGTITALASSSAAFDVGLAIPQLPAPSQPTYTPNVPTIYAGSVITLNESASGPAPLYYEWLSDGGTGGSQTPVGGFSTNASLAVNTTTFTAGSTYNYEVVVTNVFGAATSAVEPLTITGASAPIIVTDTTLTPNTTTNFAGQSETFTADIEGTLPIAYQWQVSPDGQESDAVNIPGATNATLVLNNLPLANTEYYSLLATNLVSPYTVSSTWTPFTVSSVTNEMFAWLGPVPIGGRTAGQILTNTGGSYLDAEFFGSGAGPIAVTVNGQIFTFKNDGSSASISGNQGSGTGAWLVGTNATGNTNFDTVLNNYAYNSASGIHTITLHNLVAGQQYAAQLFTVENNDSGRATDFQDPNNAADASAAYYMTTNAYMLATFTASSTDVAIQQNLLTTVGTTALGNFNAVVVRALSYTPAAQPTVLTQPASATVFAGRTVEFGVTADGIPAPAYQWQAGPVGGPYTNLVNAGRISGATNATLAIAGVTAGDSGWEFVLNVTNLAGYATSSTADLTVLPAPPLSGGYSASVLALNPVAYWPLNETNDPSVGGAGVYDASGNQYDGVYLTSAENAFDGIVGPQAADGYPQFALGQGALQSAANNVYSYVNTPALNLNTNTVTIMMWLNPNGAQANSTGLLVNRNAGTIAGFTYTTGQALGYIWNNNDAGTWGFTGGPVVPENMWSLVALVVTPTNTAFYVMNTNGVATADYPYANDNMAWDGSASAIYLGADSPAGREFNGVLDEPAVFNYALTASQLQSLAGLAFVNTNAATANFAATVTGGAGSQTFNFTWDPGHLGWQLYTNSAGLTATGSWFPVTGSAAVTNESITINPAQPNVFFQLRYP